MLAKIRKKLDQWAKYKQDVKKKSILQYIFIDAVETIAVALILALIIRQYAVQTSLVFSGSMIPTMQVKDRLVVNKFIYRFRDPERSEIILFKSPYKDKKEFVKRLIGLPGEKVEIKRGIVYINDKQLILPGIQVQRDYSYFGPERVPTDSYFVLGDNRANSADSRVWGYVPRKELLGKALFTFWPLARAQKIR